MSFYLRALAYFRRDWKLVAVLLVLVTLSILVGLLQAWPFAVLADAVLTPNPKRDFFHRLFLAPLPDSVLGQVIGVTIIGMLLTFAQDTIGLARAMINHRIRYNGTTRVRGELFDKLQELDVTYHRERPQGDSMYRVTADTWGLFGILDTFIACGIAAVYLCAMIGVMLTRNVWLTAYALSITPLMIATNVYFGRQIRRRSAIVKQADADLNTCVGRSVAAVSLVQAFGRHADSRHTFDEKNADAIRSGWKLNWREALYPWCVNTIYAMGGAVIFGYGGYLVYRDNFLHPVPDGTRIGDLVIFMAYLGKLWDPLRCLTGFFATIQGHNAAAERVFDVLDRRSPVADRPDAKPLPAEPRTLSLRNVKFAYRPDAPRVLRGIDAVVRPGEMVAFVGPSGSGKSTLLSLLSRYYNPTSGGIALDGHDLRTLRAVDLRKHLAVVAQESPLLPATIAENIAYGRPDAPRADIERAADLAGALDFIRALPDGFDTLIDDNAKNLSGGQRQRIAIARALLTDAPVLVLDEPTSALDPKQERLVAGVLSRLKGLRTIVLVTHRVDTLLACDRIYVMEAGEVVQSGTHSELLAQDGPYRGHFGVHRADREASAITEAA
jgi:subfamily B ATP-binding cassette protein MsbA